jgi:hypothetical protein
MTKKVAWTPPSITELGTRIARIADLYKNRRAAAAAAGVSTDQLGAYIKGENQPRFLTAAALAEEQDVSLDWLASVEAPFHKLRRLAKFQEQTGTKTQGVMVLGLAECGLKGWYQREPLTVSASRPGDFFDPEGFAIIAIGQSMVPAGIFEGFLCFCSPQTSPSPNDAVYVERSDNNVATIKVFGDMDADWLTLHGWLEEKNGQRQPYTERIARSVVRRVAPVIYVKRKL